MSSRHDELLDAALAEWSKVGYAQVGVKEITARASVSHGTFYNYFDNRRQLLDVLVEREVTPFFEMFDVLEREMHRPVTEESLREVITAGTAKVLNGVLARPDSISFIALEVPGIDDRALRRDIELFREAGRRAGRILDNAVADGVIDRSLNIEFAGQVWISAIFSLVVPFLADGREIGDVDRLAAEYAEIALHGVSLSN